MLQELNIKNAALIKSAEIEFNNGLNVLSGETGAGKSMVIGSLTFALGGRVSRDFIRAGEEKAVVEAVFDNIPEQTLKFAEEMGIDCGDGCLIFQRTINKEGRTSGRINGSSATASMLKELASRLVDIHSQHEHHSLLNPSKHLEILDKFCMPEIDSLKKELLELIGKYRQILAGLKEVSGNDDERQRRTELLTYKINEIDEAKLKAGEEEELNNRKRILAMAEKLVKQARQCLELIYYGNGEDASAADKIGDALKICGLMASNDENLSDILDNIDTAFTRLQEASEGLKNYLEGILADPDEIDHVEERLDVIYSLKKKYGSTIDEILKSRDEASKELEFIINSSEIRQKLTEEKEYTLKKIKSVCALMTDIRKKEAAKLQESVTKELKDLEMKNAVFAVEITRKDTFNSKGWDNVEFMISTNAGEGLKPLAKTASGGEMSRVMLGLKTVISGNESIGTFIFDEIDTGISGRTASKVAEKMARIASGQQILCITHLPQIASMADRNLLIEKYVENGKTITDVKSLERNEKVYEVIRLMGSNETEAAVKAAEEMIDFSENTKAEIRTK